jgi:uncharacterized protein
MMNVRGDKTRNTVLMARKVQRSQPVDLDALDAYLMSANAPADSVGLSDLDGFLTGLAVGPELVEPSI